MDCIDQPHKHPSINEDEEAEGKEGDVGATQASIENDPPIDKYEEGPEYDWEDNRKDTGLSDENKMRKKLHLGTKANRRHRICRIMKTKIMMMTKSVPRTTPDAESAAALTPETEMV